MTTPTLQEMALYSALIGCILLGLVMVARWTAPLIIAGVTGWLVMVGFALVYELYGSGGVIAALFLGGLSLSAVVTVNMGKTEAKAGKFIDGLKHNNQPAKMANTNVTTMLETGNGFETYNQEMWK